LKQGDGTTQATARHALLLSLQQAVQAALDARHVGVPVFVRWVAQTAGDGDELTEALGEAVAVASSWLGAPVRSVYVQGRGRRGRRAFGRGAAGAGGRAPGSPASAGQITATVQYAGGQSALVSVSAAPVRATHASPLPRLDQILLGNTGALSHDRSGLSPAQLAVVGTPSGELPSLPDTLRRALAQSLSTGTPVTVTACEGG
jgi:hypothetical protein